MDSRYSRVRFSFRGRASLLSDWPDGTSRAMTPPMKTSSRRGWMSVAAFLFLATVTQAHPGHDDGHELTWDLTVSHLAQHPYATIACAAVLGVGICAAAQEIFRRGGARLQSLRGLHSSRGK
jgi:hypothetical protein